MLLLLVLFLELLTGNLEPVDITSLVVHGSCECLNIQLIQALIVEEILHLVQVVPHVGELLHESLLLVAEVLGDVLRLICYRSHRYLLLDQAPLRFRAGVWHDIMPSHPVEELAWDLIKDLFCQELRITPELLIWHKLHDVCRHVLPVPLRVQRFLICVKLVH